MNVEQALEKAILLGKQQVLRAIGVDVARQLEAVDRLLFEIDRTEAFRQAPAQPTITNQEAWDESFRKNGESFPHVFRCALNWARLMEGAIAQGATVASCHEECRSFALHGEPTDYTTMADALLKECWLHGNELRKVD